MMKQEREKLGAISMRLLEKETHSVSPLELEREIHKEYEKNIYEAVETGRKKYEGDFYIVVVTRKEVLMPNVLRHQYMTRLTCPTPGYDQAVYKFFKNDERIDFLWVVPDKHTCFWMQDCPLEVLPNEYPLFEQVLKFTDGTLFRMAKQLNGERVDSILLE